MKLSSKYGTIQVEANFMKSCGICLKKKNPQKTQFIEVVGSQCLLYSATSVKTPNRPNKMANQLFLWLENRPKLKGNGIDRKGFIFGPYNCASVGRYSPVPRCHSAPWLQTLEMTMLSGLSRSTAGDGWKQNRAYVAFLKIMPEENWLGESKMSTNVVIGRACHQNRNFSELWKPY